MKWHSFERCEDLAPCRREPVPCRAGCRRHGAPAAAAAVVLFTAGLLWRSPKLPSWWAAPSTQVPLHAVGRRDGSRSSYASECAGVSSTCGEALGIRKVALLFLTKTDLPHELTWRLWLEGAAGQLPQQRLQAIQEAACAANPKAWRGIACACSQQQQQQQQQPWGDLFSVYVHTAPWPEFKGQGKGFGEGSVFSGRVIADRVKTQWGHISLVTAARKLVAEALKDPLNEQFVLVSGSGVPLYDPLTFYQRLMAAPKSFVSACWASHKQAWGIWTPQMEMPGLARGHMRKSSQFFSITRKHAQIFAADQAFFEHFQHCKCRQHGTPEEFYLATLLAMHNESDATHCHTPTWAQWPWPPQPPEWGAHPKSYRPAEVGPSLVAIMRGTCHNASEIQAAARMFIPAAEVFAEGGTPEAACRRVQAAAASAVPPIQPRCHVLGRKFPGDTMATVQEVFLATCQPGGSAAEGGLGLLVGGACPLARRLGLLGADS